MPSSPRRVVLAAVAAAALLLALSAAPGDVGAQPSNTPPTAPPESLPATGSYKNPNTALALSLGGTLATFALIGVGGASENGVMSSLGSVGLWIAPSFGHWYVGKGWTPGLKWRLAGAGAIAAGIMWVAVDCIGSSCNDAHPGMFLAVGGGLSFVGGMVHDVATAPSAAREHNARLEGRFQNVTVRPTFGSGRAGLALSGRF
jgi:hypothetical protein